ncbi:hypothetical protein TNCV_3808541 [Trichonephila clavipes]|nr:hypothetical protein TNCV_3808541 [Trichonephila clavipes]
MTLTPDVHQRRVSRSDMIRVRHQVLILICDSKNKKRKIFSIVRVYLRPTVKQHESFCRRNLVILNPGQVPSELASYHRTTPKGLQRQYGSTIGHESITLCPRFRDH